MARWRKAKRAWEGGGVWLFLAAEEEVEGKELEEEAVLFGEVAWRGERSKEVKEKGESEEGGESAEGLSQGEECEGRGAEQKDALNEPEAPGVMNEETEEVEDVKQRALVVPAMEVGDVPFQDAFGDVDVISLESVSGRLEMIESMARTKRITSSRIQAARSKWLTWKRERFTGFKLAAFN